MNFDLFHRLTFGLLFLALGILTFVLLERFIYYLYLDRRAGTIARGITAANGDPVRRFPPLSSRDVMSRSLAEYLEFQGRDMPRERVDDLSTALVLHVDGRVHARLWVLDTIVTAAPLLGLLGTIFGIMQTFTALAAGGVSDPAAVSRGIGTALLATAVGIATALYGLLGHNLLHRQADHLTDLFKCFLLRTTV